MKGIASVAALLSVFVSFAKAELVVIPYDGPEECSAEELIEPEKYVRIHYVGTIDHWSKTGEPGEIFDTTHGRMKTLDIQVGKGQGIPGMLPLQIVSTCAIGTCLSTEEVITIESDNIFLLFNLLKDWIKDFLDYAITPRPPSPFLPSMDMVIRALTILTFHLAQPFISTSKL